MPTQNTRLPAAEHRQTGMLNKLKADKLKGTVGRKHKSLLMGSALAARPAHNRFVIAQVIMESTGYTQQQRLAAFAL